MSIEAKIEALTAALDRNTEAMERYLAIADRGLSICESMAGDLEKVAISRTPLTEIAAEPAAPQAEPAAPQAEQDAPQAEPEKPKRGRPRKTVEGGTTPDEGELSEADQKEIVSQIQEVVKGKILAAEGPGRAELKDKWSEIRASFGVEVISELIGRPEDLKRALHEAQTNL